MLHCKLYVKGTEKQPL